MRGRIICNVLIFEFYYIFICCLRTQSTRLHIGYYLCVLHPLHSPHCFTRTQFSLNLISSFFFLHYFSTAPHTQRIFFTSRFIFFYRRTSFFSYIFPKMHKLLSTLYIVFYYTIFFNSSLILDRSVFLFPNISFIEVFLGFFMCRSFFTSLCISRSKIIGRSFFTRCPRETGRSFDCLLLHDQLISRRAYADICTYICTL